MDDLTFIDAVAGQLGCDRQQAENIIYAVFRELRDRLTPGEAADVAAQLPTALKHFWQEQERTDRRVERTHVVDFVARIRAWAALAEDDEADRDDLGGVPRAAEAPRELHRNGRRGMGRLQPAPEDLKKLWLASAPRAHRA